MKLKSHNDTLQLNEVRRSLPIKTDTKQLLAVLHILLGNTY